MYGKFHKKLETYTLIQQKQVTFQRNSKKFRSYGVEKSNTEKVTKKSNFGNFAIFANNSGICQNDLK